VESLYVGTAGWSIRREYAPAFPSAGTHLERYARRLPAVEINSSFYRPHQPATYARWAASTPPGFRFSLKLPRELTHLRRLKDPAPFAGFLEQVRELGEKLGPLLAQLPPSLPFDPKTAGDFFAALRELHDGPLLCEPRHQSWFTPEAEALLEEHRIGRVAADPALNEQAAEPGGWKETVYYRLHGSPQMYYSPYSSAYLQELSRRLESQVEAGRAVWCIFDNTAEGAAPVNALELLELFSTAGA